MCRRMLRPFTLILGLSLALAQIQAAASTDQTIFLPLLANGSPPYDHGTLVFEWPIRGGGGGLYLVTVTGATTTYPPVALTPGSQPNWSPDGQQIVFVAARTGLEGDLFVINRDGAQLTQLTDTPEDSEGEPVWSPDGTRIAFSSTHNGFQIHVMHADGSGRTQLTSGSGRATHPTWAPDGSRIAFTLDSNAPGTFTPHIAMLQADGSGQTRVTEQIGWRPEWSPDGRRILFNGAGGLWFMNPDGSHITPGPHVAATDAKWAPDSTWIIFSRSLSEYPPAPGLEVVRGDGTGSTTLLCCSDFLSPAWSPQ